MEEKIYFNNDRGDRLSGILSKPDVDTIVPIVILCHGLNSEKNSRTHMALEKVFLENNIATFRFDFFAHGESEGKIDDRSLEEFVENIQKDVEYVKSRGYKDIGLCGTSFGGVASVMVASRNHDIKVMALKAAGMGQTSRKMPNYMKHFETKSWIEAGKKVKIPALIIHGTQDKDVEIDLAEQLHKAIRTSKMIILDGADHRFSRTEDFDRSIKEISEFIIKNI